MDTEAYEVPKCRSGTITRRHHLTLDPPYANIGMYRRMKGLTWLADSRSTVKSFPAGVQDVIGYALYAAQLGEKSVKAKALHGLGGSVMEIAAYDASGTYRAIYTVSIGESIYVIHAFQKKSKAGIATPKSEMEVIRQRLKQLRSEVKDAEKRNS
jgi:phage-related protein